MSSSRPGFWSSLLELIGLAPSRVQAPAWRRDRARISLTDHDLLYRSLVWLALFVCEQQRGQYPPEAKDAIRKFFELLEQSRGETDFGRAVARGFVAALTETPPNATPELILPTFSRIATSDDRETLLHLLVYAAAGGVGFDLNRARRFVYVCEGIGMTDKDAAAFLSRLIGFELRGHSPESAFPPFIVEALGLLDLGRYASAMHVEDAVLKKAAPFRDHYAAWDGGAHTPETWHVTRLIDARRVLLAFVA